MTTSAHTQAVRLSVLGATGSIGQQTLDILKRHPGRFTVEALSARSRWRDLIEPCQLWRPRLVVLESEDDAGALRQALAAEGLGEISVLAGRQALVDAACDSRIEAVVAAISGFAGAEPVLAAAEAGKTILLANKESVVAAGHLIQAFLADGSANILPVDSEHNAIFQCLSDPNWRVGMPIPDGVSRLVLTASGGPFLGRDSSELDSVTPEQACAHPNWEMGAKISIDSATMANKALELIECCFLFACPQSSVDILIHPESLVHAMLVHRDGSSLSQLSNPDMRVAISYALARCLNSLRGQPLPARIESGAAPLDWSRHSSLRFTPLDNADYPIVAAARAALDEGPAALVCLNAINEELVQRFIDGKIKFTRIATALPELMADCPRQNVDSWSRVRAQDQAAREHCRLNPVSVI